MLEAMLQAHNGDVERTVSMLLSEGNDDLVASETAAADDAAAIRRAQSELDEQVARAVHKEIQDELKAMGVLVNDRKRTYFAA